MSPEQQVRLAQALRVMRRPSTPQGYRPCWVCANRGHGHQSHGCHVAGCPCCTRYLDPVWPTVGTVIV